MNYQNVLGYENTIKKIKRYFNGGVRPLADILETDYRSRLIGLSDEALGLVYNYLIDTYDTNVFPSVAQINAAIAYAYQVIGSKPQKHEAVDSVPVLALEIFKDLEKLIRRVEDLRSVITIDGDKFDLISDSGCLRARIFGKIPEYDIIEYYNEWIKKITSALNKHSQNGLQRTETA